MCVFGPGTCLSGTRTEKNAQQCMGDSPEIYDIWTKKNVFQPGVRNVCFARIPPGRDMLYDNN